MTAAPALAQDDEEEAYCEHITQKDVAEAKFAFVARVSRVQRLHRYGSTFHTGESGLYWVEPTEMLKGPRPLAQLSAAYDYSWSDDMTTSGFTPRRGDVIYVVDEGGYLNFVPEDLLCGGKIQRD